MAGRGGAHRRRRDGATDASSAALGTTGPRSWSASDWLSDMLPHLAYGAGVVLTFDALERR